MSATTDPTDARAIEPVHKLPGTAWRYLFGRALREFSRDNCMDLAAALTYRSVFAIFPALLALFSILGMVGQGRAGDSTAQWILETVGKYGSQDLANVLSGPIQQLTNGSGAGWAFLIGVLGAVWTASNYVTSFGRAMNRIYGVEEGRPALVLRPAMYLLTLALLIGALLCVVLLVVSGSIAQAIGDLVGLGEASVTVWNIAKWPVLVIIVVLMIASLYYFTPNVRRERFPWLSVGAAVALLTLALTTAGFAWYLSNFAKYNATYGLIGGLIALLLWIWIANSVLLFGAEIDAETERAKQLQSGLPAERELQLPARSVAASKKKQEKLEEDVLTGRQLRALANPITYEDVPDRHPWRWAFGLGAGIAALTALRRREARLKNGPGNQTPNDL
ncbi:MAG: YihY/virulence factor BrkB family protein [Arthrobacter sp.]|nr:YihY/virulence factor BrkB family protein [Arthrobacter sp.]